MDRSTLWVKILNNVGWETNQPIGSIIPMPMKYANELIVKGFVQIHVNNIGRNQAIDIDEDDFEYDFVDEE